MHKIIRPDIQLLIHQVESAARCWVGVETEMHTMGGKTFFFFEREIGHIHWNGDLDIVFGKPVTEQVLQLGLAEPHRFVPSETVTFPLRDVCSLSGAIALLKFSYLLILARSTKDDPDIRAYVEDELAQLPPVIHQLFRTQF